MDMFVAVMKNKSSLARNRIKIKKIGKIIGIYDRFVNLLLFDYELYGNNIILNRQLYVESFMFSEVFKIEESVTYER
jgi:hypothetical protein